MSRGRKVAGLKDQDGRATESDISGMPGFFIGQKKGGVMKMRFSSTEKTGEGMLVAAVVMSFILALAMLVGNFF